MTNTNDPGRNSADKTTALAPFSRFPSAQIVADFHRNADTNKRPESIHHTLGASRNQASPGDHVHDGGTSQSLLAGSFSQNLGTEQGIKDALKQIMTALTGLGMLDASTVSGSFPEIQMGNATITWTTAIALSDLLTVNFSPSFTAAPKMTLGMVSGDAAIMFSPRMNGSPTAASVGLRILASVAMGAGATRPLHWIAINMKAFT